MKFLTICQGGNVRSVGLAFRLKYGWGQDAIAASWEKNTEDTLKMLVGWSDRTVLMEAGMLSKLPEGVQELLRKSNKLVVCDVGEDRFGYAFHPELQEQCQKWCEGSFVLAETASADVSVPM